MTARSDRYLAVEDVSYTYESSSLEVLEDVSLSVQFGSFVSLVGQSGIGKSTLLRLLAGLLRPTRGRVLLDGAPAYKSTDPIGVVFQRDNLMPWRTVSENVHLPLELKGIKGVSADDRVMELIDLVGLSGFETNYPSQLSGGMAQRVAIARALVHRPALLLLDEPFGSLDALTRERMGQELLRIWHAMPVTVFMVTHSIQEAIFLSDEVLVFGSVTGIVGNGFLPATITQRIPVELDRPRMLEVQGSAAFQECVMAIRAAIQESR